MARKIKFALEMAVGAKVRNNIEELREHFDIEKAVGYFLSGKLTEWLEDRYYEEEVEALDAINKDAPDLRERLCAALGVPYEGGSELDIEALERLNEKKAVLRQKTGDESIIANADKTALTQEDLANLLDMDEPVIYLCGESFNIPARVKNKKYVGILDTPKISIKASSQEDLNAKGIIFENVVLPWQQKELPVETKATRFCGNCGAAVGTTAKFCERCGTPLNGTAATSPHETMAAAEPASTNIKWKVPKEQLKTMFESTFKEAYAQLDGDASATYCLLEIDYDNIFNRMDDNDFMMGNFLMGGLRGTANIKTSTLSENQKSMALALICGSKYTGEDLIHLCISGDMAIGWAFTRDSFCVVTKEDNAIFPYESVEVSYSAEYYGGPRRYYIEGLGKRVYVSDILGTSTIRAALKKFTTNMKNIFSRNE